MANCGDKHTKYQPTTEEWKCPLCGANNDGEYFYIDIFADDISDPDCSLLLYAGGGTFVANITVVNHFTGEED